MNTKNTIWYYAGRQRNGCYKVWTRLSPTCRVEIDVSIMNIHLNSFDHNNNQMVVHPPTQVIEPLHIRYVRPWSWLTGYHIESTLSPQGRHIYESGARQLITALIYTEHIQPPRNYHVHHH